MCTPTALAVTPLKHTDLFIQQRSLHQEEDQHIMKEGSVDETMNNLWRHAYYRYLLTRVPIPSSNVIYKCKNVHTILDNVYVKSKFILQGRFNMKRNANGVIVYNDIDSNTSTSTLLFEQKKTRGQNTESEMFSEILSWSHHQNY